MLKYFHCQWKTRCAIGKDNQLIQDQNNVLKQRMLTYSIRGKYHSTTDLLFDWIGFNQTSKSADDVYVAMQLNQKHSKLKKYSPALWKGRY